MMAQHGAGGGYGPPYGRAPNQGGWDSGHTGQDPRYPPQTGTRDEESRSDRDCTWMFRALAIFLSIGLIIQCMCGSGTIHCWHAFKMFSACDTLSQTRQYYVDWSRYQWGDPAAEGCRVDAFGVRVMFRKGCKGSCKKPNGIPSNRWIGYLREKRKNAAWRREDKFNRECESPMSQFFYNNIFSHLPRIPDYIVYLVYAVSVAPSCAVWYLLLTIFVTTELVWRLVVFVPSKMWLAKEDKFQFLCVNIVYPTAIAYNVCKICNVYRDSSSNTTSGITQFWCGMCVLLHWSCRIAGFHVGQLMLDSMSKFLTKFTPDYFVVNVLTQALLLPLALPPHICLRSQVVCWMKQGIQYPELHFSVDYV